MSRLQSLLFARGRLTFVCVFFFCVMMMLVFGSISQRFLLSSTRTPCARDRWTISEQNVSNNFSIDDYRTLLNTASDLKSYWFYIRSITNQQTSDFTKTVDDGYMAMNARLADLMEKSSTQRKYQLNKMVEYVRREIEKKQNPPDCNQARLLVQEIETLSGHGFGCTAHIVAIGLIQAFMYNRTFVLRSKKWTYANEGWEYAFLPLTKCKYEGTLTGRAGSFNDGIGNARMVEVKWDFPYWAQWRVPREFQKTLEKLHGHPYAWWIAQFTAYVTRLQPFMEKKLDDLAQEIEFPSSAVGVQIRWGDKLADEASRHEVEEYMIFVEKWFQQLEIRGKPVKRTVFLATEHKEAWDQLQKKYPQYKFIGNPSSTKIKDPESRYSHSGLENIIIDIFMLSRCNYLVCTASSHVCRAAYELMMNSFDDGSTRFQSVDALYRMRTLDPQIWVAIMDHDPAHPEEIKLKRGDEIRVDIDTHLPFNDGFLRGRNVRTGKKGKFPTFKVYEKIFSYDIRIPV